MKNTTRQIIILTLLAITPMWIAVACQSQRLAGGESPVTEQPASSEPVSESVELSDSTIEFGPGAFDLDDPATGLDQLSSYQAELALHFEGFRNGQAEEWSQTIQMRTVRGETPFRQVIVNGSGPVASQRFMADTNGTRYEKVDNGECSAESLAEIPTLESDLEPALMLFPLHGADEAQAERIDGVDARRYTFDARALGESELTEAQGEVWVASDGGYVLRYAITKKGGETYYGEGMEGAMTWEYTLTDINQPLDLDLPEDCSKSLVEAPVMPDAANLEQWPELTKYTTSASVEDVLAFYAEELPALGWELKGEPASAETTGLTTYTLGDQQLTIIITPVETGRSVWLLQDKKLEEPPE